jgi:hypothetical protein
MRNCAFYNTCARTVKKIKFSAMVPFFAMRAILQPAVPAAFLPACTFVQRGSKNCFVVVVLLLGATLVRILHYCPISPCFQHIAPLHAVWPGHLARQPCPAALPTSLAEKFSSCFTAVGRHACSIAYFYSAGSLVQGFPAIKNIAILSLVHKLISTRERG